MLLWPLRITACVSSLFLWFMSYIKLNGCTSVSFSGWLTCELISVLENGRWIWNKHSHAGVCESVLVTFLIGTQYPALTTYGMRSLFWLSVYKDLSAQPPGSKQHGRGGLLKMEKQEHQGRSLGGDEPPVHGPRDPFCRPDPTCSHPASFVAPTICPITFQRSHLRSHEALGGF